MRVDFAERLDKSESIHELNRVYSLPEPYDDSGYYLVYYCESDYRYALADIVELIDSGMRIYYDRYLESGAGHIKDFCKRALGSHCRCVVFYLSEGVFDDPTFHALLRVVGENNLPAISVNRSIHGGVRSGERMAEGKELAPDVREFVNKNFSDEVTFIPYDLPIGEKIRELRRAYEMLTMHFTVVGDFAVAEYVKDLSEDEVVIPASIEINGVDYPVRAVSARAFSGCRELTRVVFPDTIEDIGYGCDDESLGEVFENCESLTEIVYPPRVKYLYGGMFGGCKSLKRLLINEDCEFRGTVENHFNFLAERGADLKGKNTDDDMDTGTLVKNPHALEYLKLPRAAKVIFNTGGEVRFSYNSSGKCLTAYLSCAGVEGGEVISISPVHHAKTVSEVYMFPGNKQLLEATFDRDFVFGDRWIRVFYGCSSLRRVQLPETVYVLESTFYECGELTEVVLPQSMAALDSLAFYKCTSLKSIRLPEFVCYVADSAFLGCHLERVICDSPYAENIFKSGYRQPIEVFVERRPFIRAITKLTYRMLATKKELTSKGFHWWADVDYIYIKDSVKPFEIEGYVEMPTDMAGYRRYRCNISFVERLKYKGEQVKK